MPRISLPTAPHLVAMLGGTFLAFAVSELAVREYIKRQQFANSLEALSEFRESESENNPGETGLANLIQVSRDSAQFYELAPNLDVQFGGVRVLTNSTGMRGRQEYSFDKEPDTVRIVGIGDSGMFGWEVEEGEDYLSILEKQLQASSPAGKFEVLNLAVPGYNTQLEFESLRLKGLAYDPDVAVVGWCVNDVKLPIFLMDKEHIRYSVSYIYQMLFQPELFRESLASSVAPPGANQKNVPDSLRVGHGVTGVERMFIRLKELSQQKGFKLLIFGPLAPDKCRVLDREQIDYCNTLEVIPKDTYPDEWKLWAIHPTSEGHRVLGEYLASELDRRGWLTP